MILALGAILFVPLVPLPRSKLGGGMATRTSKRKSNNRKGSIRKWHLLNLKWLCFCIYMYLKNKMKPEKRILEWIFVKFDIIIKGPSTFSTLHLTLTSFTWQSPSSTRYLTLTFFYLSLDTHLVFHLLLDTHLFLLVTWHSPFASTWHLTLTFFYLIYLTLTFFFGSVFNMNKRRFFR